MIHADNGLWPLMVKNITNISSNTVLKNEKILDVSLSLRPRFRSG